MAPSVIDRVLARLRVHAPWRRMWPRRAVFREVQGVMMWLPWSHRLPDYAAYSPAYGQNLVRLAEMIADPDSQPLQVIDVGANIGDSALQILDKVESRVLAVEADPYYLGFLRRNTASTGAVTIAPVLLTSGDQDRGLWSPSRRGGTTSFRPTGSSSPETSSREGPETLAVPALPHRFRAFDRVRLVKSDTDGFDSELIPALARVYAHSRPVLFFEYDPALTTKVSGNVAGAVWERLAELGYSDVAVWDNQGYYRAGVAIDRAAEVSAALLEGTRAAHPYLDVAVAHSADATGRAALQNFARGDLSRT